MKASTNNNWTELKPEDFKKILEKAEKQNLHGKELADFMEKEAKKGQTKDKIKGN